MTASVHKLTAGSGYDYLTRQVAAMDSTEKGYTGLASYYTERGETPGKWVGSGMTGIDGLSAGDTVTAEQMQALFGSGHHPLAAQRKANLAGPDLKKQDYEAITRLGSPFKVYDNDISDFRKEVAERMGDLNEREGLKRDAPLTPEQRATIRTEVAREVFQREHGRQPEDARELAATVAKHSRPQTRAVAGYDVTFSPVKSVSTLWAVADTPVAAIIEQAHHDAVADALRFLETHALYSRTGTNGVRQVDVQGMVATAFTHRDSRAGDPDLHSHIAIANKVQTDDGRWLSIDGRVLFKAMVSISETYNTALEKYLRQRLGVQFEERAGTDTRKRPIREIVGVDAQLNNAWSTRRARIDVRRNELAAQFQRTHNRPPSPVEALQLAQQATLETREAKHEPRSIGEQRRTWRADAIAVLGGEKKLTQMIRTALSPSAKEAEQITPAWVASTADRIVDNLQNRRAHWQTWHVRAEAQRQVRAANLPGELIEPTVDALVATVLTERSINLARPVDDLTEPAKLCRRDGTSVYDVAGATMFTSRDVLDAEERLVSAAGRVDGMRVAANDVDLALLEQSANGPDLNAGQVTLVREMAMSGRRVQLAIAPAGSGKTTAMKALTTAWANGGGTVVGLAPRAGAAKILHGEIGVQTDTLAKLTDSLQKGILPDWVKHIDNTTLVVIDEAGTADTLSLDRAVSYILSKGGSVRLIGDDQQLSAIGAGGVLRDIQATHGALQLSELHRFVNADGTVNVAEGAASLALRAGKPEGLGYYLDHGRVHVGDMATMTEAVFTAWATDRTAGLDAIMLAPTRDLVSQLNQRARAHRLADEGGTNPRARARTVHLADGNDASIGDVLITRANRRDLRVSSSDWVKNGDRWTLEKITRTGSLRLRRLDANLHVTVPADYVAASVELGYATTTNAAQGATSDTCHGLFSGEETRQELYTALSRARRANHLYLQVASDGDPHSVVHPDLVVPPTATDELEAMVANDGSARSATTLLRDAADPAELLGAAASRYQDALYFAAEDLLGEPAVSALEAGAERAVPGVTNEPAWPALRAHLILIGASGKDPIDTLQAAAARRELTTADDVAAVLDWRLDPSGLRDAGQGPLPWIPAVPKALVTHKEWGPYLTARDQLVRDRASVVGDAAAHDPTAPNWVPAGAARPTDAVVAEVAVWRAAMHVDPDDRRPTGPQQLQKAVARWQSGLHHRALGGRSPATDEWAPLLRQIAPQVLRDSYAPVLAEHLASMSRAGVPARAVLHRAAEEGVLPDDHAAAALWWRISAHLGAATTTGADESLTTDWSDKLPDLLGPDRAAQVRASTSWPALVAAVDHAIQRGWTVQALLSGVPDQLHDIDVDWCQALLWRVQVAMDPIPDEDRYDERDYEQPPEDAWAAEQPVTDGQITESADPVPEYVVDAPPPSDDDMPWDLDLGDTEPIELDRGGPTPEAEPAQGLAFAALRRDAMGPLEPSERQLEQASERANRILESQVTPDRIAQINELTLQFYEKSLPDSWAAQHLRDRFGVNLVGDLELRPGFAPPGWDTLITHLRAQGVTDQEMIAANVAIYNQQGRLRDRFVNRLVMPIIHRRDGWRDFQPVPFGGPDVVLGFVGRRHPDLTDEDKAGPKYLNTAETALFVKGEQLYVAGTYRLAAGATPVLVEGPMDAIAVTVSTDDCVGVAPLGTSLTEEQADQLARLGRNPVVATDADAGGQVAAERDFWLLAQHGMDSEQALFPAGFDPAELAGAFGPERLHGMLFDRVPLAETLLQERLTNLPAAQALSTAAKIIAARPARFWESGIAQVSNRLKVSTRRAQQEVLSAARAFTDDPRKAAQDGRDQAQDTKKRIQAKSKDAQIRWAEFADSVDPRLVEQSDWKALAMMLDEATAQGHDVAAAVRELVGAQPLGQLPAQDLRYRLVAKLDLLQPPGAPVAASTATLSGAEQQRRRPATPLDRGRDGPRR
ncbi:MobF family relaxase [Flexivirga caeni]|uniref:Toprim domain-containing protein n=1 Tax=Flexivirga caeni TaxID=2294115 RepID=A0A3M9MGZ5_9MICO|nr:MobF family relaxase [Flexivirga caeni]RNI24801.1 toprim domain-containing protein [Flexivirga caeni]